MTSKEYIEKYSWLKIKDEYEQDEDVFCAMDFMPDGWREAFGDQMCEDFDRIIKKLGLENDFTIDEIKEKYGQLRIYFSPVNQELYNIVRTYEAISETVCLFCGTIENVRFINWGWVMPCCDHCYKSISNNRNMDRFLSLDIETLPNVVKWTRFGNSGTEHHEMDISESAKKVRDRFIERINNNEIERIRNRIGDR